MPLEKSFNFHTMEKVWKSVFPYYGNSFSRVFPQYGNCKTYKNHGNFNFHNLEMSVKRMEIEISMILLILEIICIDHKAWKNPGNSNHGNILEKLWKFISPNPGKTLEKPWKLHFRRPALKHWKNPGKTLEIAFQGARTQTLEKPWKLHFRRPAL